MLAVGGGELEKKTNATISRINAQWRRSLIALDVAKGVRQFRMSIGDKPWEGLITS